MNIQDALKFVIQYYNSNEFDYAQDGAKEAIEDLVDAAKWLLEKYGENPENLEAFNIHNMII